MKVNVFSIWKIWIAYRISLKQHEIKAHQEIMWALWYGDIKMTIGIRLVLACRQMWLFSTLNWRLIDNNGVLIWDLSDNIELLAPDQTRWSGFYLKKSEIIPKRVRKKMEKKHLMGRWRINIRSKFLGGGTRIGIIHQDSGTSYATFEYGGDFSNSDIELSPIRMPLVKKNTLFQVYAHWKSRKWVWYIWVKTQSRWWKGYCSLDIISLKRYRVIWRCLYDTLSWFWPYYYEARL